MKRTLTAAVVLFFAFQSYAAETQRYIVNTKRPARQLPQLLTADIERDQRMVGEFETLNGFVADLTPEEAAALAASPNVRYVEPAIERHAFGLTAVSNESRNLTGQTTTYGLNALRASDVWPVSRGANVNVVVIDTGVDYHHPELAAVWQGGFDFVTNDADPMDEAQHGTHVSGTIAAADNNDGVVGVAPQVKLWGARVLDATGSGSTANVVRAVDWAIARKRELGGNWILNLSLGSSNASPTEREAFGRAVSEGIVVVAASGNESIEGVPAEVAYPAAYPGVISVGAVDESNKIAVFSNQGPSLSVVAPGVEVLSTLPIGKGTLAYVSAGATSFSGAPITGAKLGTVSGQFVYCGLGKAGEFPPGVSGKIAVIKRGDIRFSEKTKNAKEAGASAVVIFNRDDSALSFTLVNDDEPWGATYDWPVTVAISLEDGEALIKQTGAISVAIKKDDYGRMSGTSMATPHVAGLTALVWGAAPTANAEAVKNAIIATAHDLGATGRDNVYGSGLVDALDAAKTLAPGAFSSPSTPAPSAPPSGRRVLIRGRR